MTIIYKEFEIDNSLFSSQLILFGAVRTKSKTNNRTAVSDDNMKTLRKIIIGDAPSVKEVPDESVRLFRSEITKEHDYGDLSVNIVVVIVK